LESDWVRSELVIFSLEVEPSKSDEDFNTILIERVKDTYQALAPIKNPGPSNYDLWIKERIIEPGTDVVEFFQLRGEEQFFYQVAVRKVDSNSVHVLFIT